MVKKIKVIGKPAERIQDIGPAQRRIEPAEFAAAIGAEPCGPRVVGDLDPISLAELGNSLLKQLRSTGGRPALAGATEHCKVPLTPEDIAALEQIIAAIARQTGAKPSLGQITSVIVRTHLDLVRTPQPPGTNRTGLPKTWRNQPPHSGPSSGCWRNTSGRFVKNSIV